MQLRTQAMCNNFINFYGGKRKRYYMNALELFMNDLYGFLHRHPKKEADANLDSEHVIVDKKDWEAVHFYFEEFTKDYNIFKELFTTFKAMDATRCDMDHPE
jgi:hypothetical protein